MLSDYVDQIILDNSLVDKKSKIVLGCSGGADSLALLSLVTFLNYEVIPVFVNHKTPMSDQFWISVNEACNKISNKFDIEVNPQMLYIDGELPDRNYEAIARQKRYDVLNSFLKKVEFDYVAIAHTLDDNAETILHNLMRGSVEGLGGMQVLRDNIWRPFLKSFRRSDSIKICEMLELSFVNDPANQETKYSRVRIRSELLPLMSDISKRDVAKILSRNASIFQKENMYLDSLASSQWPDVDCSVKKLLELDEVLAHRAVRLWIGSPKIRSVDVEKVMKVVKGEVKAVELEGYIRVFRSKGILYFERKKDGE